MSKRVHNTFQTALKEKKIIAFDVGHKYIGVASSSVSFHFASPKEVLKWDSDTTILMEYLKNLFSQYSVSAVVLGDTPDNNNDRMKKALGIVSSCIKEMTEVPVYFVNERSSTQEADNRLALLEEETKERKDAIAAQIILERFLEAHGHEVL